MPCSQAPKAWQGWHLPLSGEEVAHTHTHSGSDDMQYLPKIAQGARFGVGASAHIINSRSRE